MRRLHVQQVRAGPLTLGPAESHHARDVLRLEPGTLVELFDDAGRTGEAVLIDTASEGLCVEVREVRAAKGPALDWTIAAAVPKGNRADWLVEKLSELGATRFVPLAAARSVVLPEGQGKIGRWKRLAAEAARQSRRVGVMEVAELMELREWLQAPRRPAWYFSTVPGALPAARAIESFLGQAPAAGRQLTLLVGPEGGWSEEEIRSLDQAGLTPVSLGTTILRMETAAVAGAALVAAMILPALGDRPLEMK